MRPILMPLVLSALLATSAPAIAAPAAPDAAALAAVDALLEKRDPRAQAAVAALRKAAPTSVDAGVRQVRLLLQQDKAEDALELAEELADAAPGHAGAQFWLGNAYGDRLGQVGLLTQARYAPKLRAAFERAIALDPDLHDARLYLIEFHLRAPSIVGGDRDVAMALLRELARRDPPRGEFARGRIAEVDGDLDAAATAFVAAWKARPENERWRLAAGYGLQEAERWDDAHAHFMRWTKEDPANAAACYQLGRLAALSGRHLDDGAAALQRYLRMPRTGPELPDPQHAWLRLGQVQVHAGDKVAARRSLEQALKLDPELEDAEVALAKL